MYELVEHPDRAFDNMQSTFNVLEHARKNGIKKFIFASSRECYGNLDMDTLTEDLARVENCESPYTASKVAGEALIHSYHNCYDLDAVIIRFSNVYGAYDDSVRVVPLFIRLAEANEQITVFGRDKNLDFTYIDDACLGVECVIEHFDAAKGDTFNIAYGEGNTILRLAEYIKELKGSKSDIQVGESRTGEITHYVADTSKARTVLGFNPQIPFDDGVRQAVEWYSAHT